MIKNLVTDRREQKGVSKAHLARRIGVSRSYVTRLEQGKIQPSGEVMFRLAGYFGCSIEEIFQWAGKGSNCGRVFFGPECCLKGITEAFAPAVAKPAVNQSANPPARPAGMEPATDKSLVDPTAKAVASPVAQSSQPTL